MTPKFTTISRFDRMGAKARYLRALRDCNERVDTGTHPDLRVPESRLKEIMEYLESLQFSSHQQQGSANYKSAVASEVLSMEDTARMLPGQVGAWKVLVELDTSLASSTTSNASYRPILAPVQPGTSSIGAPSTVNSAIPKRKIAILRPLQHGVQSQTLTVGDINTGGGFGTTFHPRQSMFSFGASFPAQGDDDDDDERRLNNLEPPKRFAAKRPDQDDASQLVLFDDEALAMNPALNPTPRVQEAPTNTFGTSAAAPMPEQASLSNTSGGGTPAPMPVQASLTTPFGTSALAPIPVQAPVPTTFGPGASVSTTPPPPCPDGQSPKEEMDVDSGDLTSASGTGAGNMASGNSLAPSQVVPQARTQGVPSKQRTISVMGGMRKSTAPASMPQFPTGGLGFRFGSSANAPTRPSIRQTETPANVAPLSNVMPPTSGETYVSIDMEDAPTSAPPSAPPAATYAPQHSVRPVTGGLQDTRSQDTTGAGNVGQLAGPPVVLQAIPDTATTAPASIENSQLSQMAAMLQSLQSDFATMQAALKIAENKYASDMKAVTDRMQILREENTGYASRIATLEDQMQSQALEASRKYDAAIAALTEKCDALERSQAARKEPEPEPEPEPVDEAIEEPVRKHDPSKGSYGLDYSSDDDEESSEDEELVAEDGEVIADDVVPAVNTTNLFIDGSAMAKGQLRLISSSPIAEDGIIPLHAEIITLLIQYGMPKESAQSHAIHLTDLFNFISAYTHMPVELPDTIHKEASAFVAKVHGIFSDAKQWFDDIGRVSDVHVEMWRFAAVVKTYEGLAGLDALLKTDNLHANMELCVAYLKAVTALWCDMFKDEKRKVMHQFLKDEDVRLRARVNGRIQVDGLFVTDRWAVETRSERQ